VTAAKINDMDFGEDGDEIIFDTKEDDDEDIDDVGWSGYNNDYSL